MRKIINIFRKWRLRDYTPLIEILIYKNRLLENLHTFQSAHPRMEFAPVLKSNAYGHGLYEVASILEGEACPFLCVDSYFEAMTLRAKGIRAPLLVIGYIDPENIKRRPLKNTSYAIVGLEHLKEMRETIKTPLAFHLKIDTGMRRQGILPEEISEAVTIIKNTKNIKIDGIFSHFADADNSNTAFTEKQIEIWNKCIRGVRSEIGGIRYAHLAATAGSFYSKKIEANAIRLGLGLYGYDPHQKRNLNLKPVLEMRTKITSIRKIKKEEVVGYGLTFKARQNMTIATIPAGYYEGVDRRLSNKGFVTINNVPCKIIGRVSMNMTCIDVSNIPKESLKNSVTVISTEPKDKNSVEGVAHLCKTNRHEILVHIPAHLRRIIV